MVVFVTTQIYANTLQMYANTLQDEEDPDMPAQEVKMLFQNIL